MVNHPNRSRRLDAGTAHDALQRCGIGPSANFYTLSHSQVDALLGEADLLKYRKPKNANGSRGRYFHAYLLRSINRKEED